MTRNDGLVKNELHPRIYDNIHESFYQVLIHSCYRGYIFGAVEEIYATAN